MFWIKQQPFFIQASFVSWLISRESSNSRVNDPLFDKGTPRGPWKVGSHLETSANGGPPKRTLDVWCSAPPGKASPRGSSCGMCCWQTIRGYTKPEERFLQNPLMHTCNPGGFWNTTSETVFVVIDVKPEEGCCSGVLASPVLPAHGSCWYQWPFSVFFSYNWSNILSV